MLFSSLPWLATHLEASDIGCKDTCQPVSPTCHILFTFASHAAPSSLTRTLLPTSALLPTCTPFLYRSSAVSVCHLPTSFS